MTEVVDVVREIQNKKHDVRNKIKSLDTLINRILTELSEGINLPDYDLTVTDDRILIQFFGVDSDTSKLTSSDIEIISNAITDGKSCHIFSQSSGNINLEWPW